MGTVALIGLGSNLGDRKAVLDQAIAGLSEIPGVESLRVSTYHETAPVGGPSGQGAFLNAAAAVETRLDPTGLHAALRLIEAQAGRAREIRWDARTLDLDLLLFGDRILDTAELQVPHPRMAFRRFVLAPLAEVAPEAVEPRTQRTVRELLENLDRRPGYIAFAEGGVTWAAHEPQQVEGGGSEGTIRAAPGVHASGSLSARFVARFPMVRMIRAEEWSGTLKDRNRARTPPRRVGEETRIAASQLGRHSWSKPADFETWIVSDFWFDEIYLRRYGNLDTHPAEWLHSREFFLRLRQEVLPPTFVVIADRRARDLGLRPERFPEHRPIGRDVPLLIPESNSLDAMVDEILAACRSTRV